MARQHVVWLGQEPSASAVEALKIRGLIPEVNPSVNADIQDLVLAKARGLILSVSGPEDPLLDQAYNGLLAAAFAHGLSVRLLAPLEAMDEIDRRFKDWESWRRPEMVGELALLSALNYLLSDQPGRAYDKAVKLTGDANHLTIEEQLLLRRAFNDAEEVKLTSLSGGNSAKVFQAYASLRDSRIGLQPLPFFVKLDRRPKILRELKNYADCTSLFVPFYARPNLDPSRCALGFERGVLVGNFVEFSRSLAELVRDGTASRAIHSLFEDALRGWRRQAFIDPNKTVLRRLAASFGGAVYPDSVKKGGGRAERVARQAKTFGATRSATDLSAAIDNLPPIRHRCALAHGDLHADNVRVRDGQAILIDFASTQQRPLTADPAALEASLILHSTEADQAVWKAFVDEAYSLAALRTLPAPGPAGASMDHLRNAVRDIRRMALLDCLHADEYAIAVAIYLLRHAYRAPSQGEPAERRSYLFATADKLVSQLGA